MKNINFFFLVFFLFVLASCDSQTSLSSIDFDACFMSYKNSSELDIALQQMTQTIESTEKPSASTITVVGCLNYQLGNQRVAETWLKRAFKESKDSNTKSIAGSALSLIYLKESNRPKITEAYKKSAEGHYLGRWMLVLYYLDLYRETGFGDHLLSAVQMIELKHQQEGATSATSRLLEHMKLIGVMTEVCDSTPESEACSQENLEGEKYYLFSTAHGFLLMLLKKPPFNNI